MDTLLDQVMLSSFSPDIHDHLHSFKHLFLHSSSQRYFAYPRSNLVTRLLFNPEGCSECFVPHHCSSLELTTIHSLSVPRPLLHTPTSCLCRVVVRGGIAIQSYLAIAALKSTCRVAGIVLIGIMFSFHIRSSISCDPLPSHCASLMRALLLVR